MRARATQLILPFESALPSRKLILAPRLWPTMTPQLLRGDLYERHASIWMRKCRRMRDGRRA